MTAKDSVLCANRGFRQGDVLGTQPSIVGPRLPKRPNGGRIQQKGVSATVGIQTPTTTAKSKDNI